MNSFKRIIIIDSEKPKDLNLNQEIQWFSNCLGMFNKRDKEKSRFRIFINLLKEKQPMSSEQIAQNSNLSRATVIHHLARLRDSGLVIEENKRYALRINNLCELTQSIEEDILSTFKNLKQISREIDKELQIGN